MMAHGFDDELPTIDLGRVQAVLIPQIERSVVSMHHIDELFQWLANVLLQYFNIQLLLIWANRTDQYGQSTAQLRTIAHQDASFPSQIIANEQVQRLAQHLIVERLTYKMQPLDTLFSPYQTLLLKRYGLYYWGACFNSKNALLPVRQEVLAGYSLPAFLAMTTLVFFKQMPPANIVQSIGTVLDKAIESALVRGLLVRPAEPQVSVPFSSPITPFPVNEVTPPLQERRPQLAQLIPEQKQNENLMLSDNPFKSAPTISDKKARRLYGAINGQDTVSRLASATSLSMQEVSVALRILWDEGRIEVRGPDGQPVELLFFLNER